jgi:hypothetical protein
VRRTIIMWALVVGGLLIAALLMWRVAARGRDATFRAAQAPLHTPAPHAPAHMPLDPIGASDELVTTAKREFASVEPADRAAFLGSFGRAALALLQARDARGPQALSWSVNSLVSAGEIDLAVGLLNEAIAIASSNHPPMAHSFAARRLELLMGRLSPQDEAAEIERWFDQAAALKLEPDGLRSRAVGLLTRHWEMTANTQLASRLAFADRAMNYLGASAGADLHAWYTQESTEALQRAGDDGRADQRMEAFLARFPDWEHGQQAREYLIMNHALREAVTQAHPSNLGIGEANRLGEVLDRGLITDPWRRLQAMGWRCVALKEARQPGEASAQARQMLTTLQDLLAQPGALTDEHQREVARAHLGNMVIGYPGRLTDQERRTAAQLYLLHTPEGVNADAARALLAAP